MKTLREIYSTKNLLYESFQVLSCNILTWFWIFLKILTDSDVFCKKTGYCRIRTTPLTSFSKFQKIRWVEKLSLILASDFGGAQKLWNMLAQLKPSRVIDLHRCWNASSRNRSLWKSTKELLEPRCRLMWVYNMCLKYVIGSQACYR